MKALTIIPIGLRSVGPMDPEDWTLDSLCVDQLDDEADLWFDSEQSSPEREQAKAICSYCPVQKQCLDGALEREEEYGIWGGVDFETPADQIELCSAGLHDMAIYGTLAGTRGTSPRCGECMKIAQARATARRDEKRRQQRALTRITLDRSAPIPPPPLPERRAA